jgi:hypothetical protein
MEAFVFLLVCLVALVIFASRIYGGRGDEPVEVEDRRVDRLAAILDVDVMEGLTRLSQDGPQSEADLANRLLREGIQKEDGRPR